LFLLNGKPSPQLGKNVAEVLQNFPASSILRIEVITNPSAKYKPDGSGGIINIVLKENTKQGMNGSVALNAGNRDRYNGNVSFSYKPGKLNFYSTLGIRQNSNRRYNLDDRKYNDSIGILQSNYLQIDTATGKSFSQSALVGLDYELDSSNTFSLLLNYLHYSVGRENISQRIFSDENHTYTQHYNRNAILKKNESEAETTIAWEHRFKKEDHTLAIELLGVRQDEHEYQYNTQEYFLPSYPSSKDNILLDKKDNPIEAVLDYSWPISKETVIEAGYSGLFNSVHINNRWENYDSISQSF